MKRGTWRALGANLVDLPGTYSLIASSPDEQVVSDTLSGAEGSFTDPRTGRKVDLAIVLLDASAMTRSLYLLGQVAQAGHPVVAVATMVDVSEKDGQKYPVDKLADELGIPVLAVDPRHYDNPELLEGIVRHALEHHARPKGLPLNAADGSCTCGCGGLTQADELFAWVDRVETAVVGKAEGDPILSTSDKIDRVLLNPWLGIPIFFILMWFLFKVAGEWGSPVQDFFDRVFSSTDEGFPSLANGITYLFTLGGLQDGWLHSFLIGGLCTGLGVVSSFIPLMFIIFLMISILEDSGLSTVPRTSRVPGSACFRDCADYVAACVGLREGRRQDYLGNDLRCVAHGCNSHGGELLFRGFRTAHGRFSLRAHRPGA